MRPSIDDQLGEATKYPGEHFGFFSIPLLICLFSAHVSMSDHVLYTQLFSEFFEPFQCPNRNETAKSGNSFPNTILGFIKLSEYLWYWTTGFDLNL